MADKLTKYHGESQCEAIQASGKHEGGRCTNKTYYYQGGKYVCGMHSTYDKRRKLLKNPHAKDIKADQIKKHQESVEAARIRNQKDGRSGGVRCSKIGMMTRPEDIPGYLKVFPNHKHQNRKDGFGCCSLSPMQLGPVDHGQKDLPKCRLLENYHQFNKVYDCDLNKEKKANKAFYTTQLKAYTSKTGSRHKYTGKMMINGVNRRPRTLYSLHRDRHRVERRYDYVQSRYLYCHFYQNLVQGNKDLAKLRTMLKDGTNLQIVGYDGYNVDKDLMFYYTDTSRPFGHELVLYTLLTVSNPGQYPWNKYYEMHSDIYPPHLKPDYMKTEQLTQTNIDGKSKSGKKDADVPGVKKTVDKVDKMDIEEKSDVEQEEYVIEDYDTE